MEDRSTGIVNTTSTSTITLASIDLTKAVYGGQVFTGVPAGKMWFNAIAMTLLVRAHVTMFEVGGGTYSTSWEKVACFRVTGSSVPTLIGSVVDGNAASGGRLGDPDVSAVTLDVSGTIIRLRVTPAGAGSRDWFGAIDLIGKGTGG